MRHFERGVSLTTHPNDRTCPGVIGSSEACHYPKAKLENEAENRAGWRKTRALLSALRLAKEAAENV
jgi:hypothetical protein